MYFKCIYVILTFVLLYQVIVTGQENNVQCGQVDPKVFIDSVQRITLAIDVISDPVGSWPWMISAGYAKRGGSWQHVCGGSIITKKHVLTAAHCTKRKARIIDVRAGDRDLADSTDNLHVQVRRIRRTFQHDLYNPEGVTAYYDVAVWEVDPFQFDIYVRPICLPTSSSPFPDKYAGHLVTITGWGAFGSTPDKAVAEDVLRELPIRLYSQSYCNSTHTIPTGNSIYDRNIHAFLPRLYQSDLFCAGYERGGGSCHGDSGSPMVGLVIGGVSKCGDAKIPSIYLRIEDINVWSFVKRFITGDDSCNGNDICDFNAQCKSSIGGSFTCQCNPGYVGNGKSCTAARGGTNTILMVIGGEPESAYNDVELIDISGKDRNCKQPQTKYPGAKMGSTGAFLNDEAHVCGGGEFLTAATSDCYRYNSNDASWSKTASLNNRRAYAASILLDYNNWWITGGENANGDPYSSTEILDRNSRITSFIDLPGNRSFHNLITVGPNRVMLLGGHFKTKETYFYDGNSGKWTAGPPMSTGMGFGQAGLVIFNNGTKAIVAAGGWKGRSTEILNIDTNKWRKGPDLPFEIWNGASVQLQNTFAIVGGYDGRSSQRVLDTIITFDTQNENWILSNQRLRTGRAEHTAFLVNDSYC